MSELKSVLEELQCTASATHEQHMLLSEQVDKQDDRLETLVTRDDLERICESLSGHIDSKVVAFGHMVAMLMSETCTG